MQTNAVRFDIRERDKRLTCKETLALASVCTFSLFRDGVALERDGWLIFRLIKCRNPGTPEDVFGLSAVQFTAGVTGESAVLREWWLVNLLCHLPVGTVTQLAVTAVDKEEGVIGEGVVDVLVGTVAEVTQAPYYDPEERAALFKGERGAPGVAVVDDDPQYATIDPGVHVAVNRNGLSDFIREVPPCPESGYEEDHPYVLIAHSDGSYGWAKWTPRAELAAPGDLPGKILIDDSTLQLVQNTMKWNAKAQRYEENSAVYQGSQIPTIGHASDHSDGVL